MSFIRTSSGLSNQHLFYNVDAIVFIEGGKVSYSKTDVYGGKSNEHSIDLIYWGKLFRKFRSDLNLKFKAVGSKTTVKSIAIDIIKSGTTTVIAAMDSEFDEIHNKKIIHNNVLYTKGYSWENDVWDASIIISLLQDISGQEIEHPIINTALDNFYKTVKIGVYADCYLFKKNDSLFPRKGHLQCVDCSSLNIPSAKKQFIEALLIQKNLKKENLYSYGSRWRITPSIHCYGHLLGDFCFHLLRYYALSKLKAKSLPKEIFERLAITKFINSMEPKINLYYSTKLGLVLK